MIGTAWATFPTSSSVCIIFLIRPWQIGAQNQVMLTCASRNFASCEIFPSNDNYYAFTIKDANQYNKQMCHFYGILSLSSSVTAMTEKDVQYLLTAGKRALYFFFLLGMLFLYTGNGSDFTARHGNGIHARTHVMQSDV